MGHNFFGKIPLLELKELLIFNQSGVWGEEGDSSDTPVLRSTNIHDGHLVLDKVAYRKITENDKERYRLEKGDILVTKSSGSQELIGKCCRFSMDDNKTYVFSNFVQRLRVDSKKIDSDYLFFYLNSPFAKAVLRKINNTTSGLRNLNMRDYEQQLIPVPPLPLQRKIASILEKCESAKQKRKEANRLTDEFLKSAFLEMFGDPIKNPKNARKLTEVCGLNPRLESDISNDKEVSFVPMSAVSTTGEIDTSQIRKYGEVKIGFTYFREGDVLFAKITPCMENGKGGIAKNLKNGIGFGSTEFHILRPSKDVNSEWIYFLLSFKHLREIAARNMTGTAGQKRVPVSFLQNLKVSIPSIELQQKFAGLVQKVEKLKEKQCESEKELNNLFNSLMQKAFRGDIFN